MGPVGWQEMVVIFVVALVLFGPRKLPELGRTLGKAISEFRRASNELKSTFEREMQAIERENESLKEVTRAYVNDAYTSYNESGYDSPSHDSGAYGSYNYGYESTDSSTSHPSTNGESAVQDAGSEAHGSAVPAVEGTVPRTPGMETASATPHETPANGTGTQTAEPEPEAHRS
jgi:sec-independent protein translocase protein TatA